MQTGASVVITAVHSSRVDYCCFYKLKFSPARHIHSMPEELLSLVVLSGNEQSSSCTLLMLKGLVFSQPSNPCRKRSSPCAQACAARTLIPALENPQSFHHHSHVSSHISHTITQDTRKMALEFSRASTLCTKQELTAKTMREINFGPIMYAGNSEFLF